MQESTIQFVSMHCKSKIHRDVHRKFFFSLATPNPEKDKGQAVPIQKPFVFSGFFLAPFMYFI